MVDPTDSEGAVEEVLMPFRTFTRSDGEFRLGSTRPDPELRQIAARKFLLLRSFCYRAPRNDPDEGTVYIVPGVDFAGPGPAPATRDAAELGERVPLERVVVPPDATGVTDLASVPPVFWWLVASYGNHTQAALLHDALYAEKGEATIPRRTADRLLLSALRESPDKGGPFRHWLMWAAVSGFGTMRYRLGALFALHVVAVWALTIGAVAWAWGDGLSWWWWQILAAVVVALVFLVVLGSSWRAGVDLTGGWLVPTVLTAAIVFVPLAIEWTYPFEFDWSPFTLLLAAAALTIVGPLWGLWVDPTLRGWLWPTAAIGLPLAVVPAVLILVALLLVWFVDLGAALTAAQRKTPDGEERPFELPSLEQAQMMP
jgi:hypothetical protein